MRFPPFGPRRVALFSSLSTNTTLTRLSLPEFEDPGDDIAEAAAALAVMLRRNLTLRQLHLNCSCFQSGETQGDAAVILGALGGDDSGSSGGGDDGGQQPPLVVGLSHLRVDVAAAAELGASLRRCGRLEFLDLGWDKHGGAALCEEIGRALVDAGAASRLGCLMLMGRGIIDGAGAQQAADSSLSLCRAEASFGRPFASGPQFLAILCTTLA